MSEDFLPIATNGCGDYFALRRDEGLWGPTVWLLDHEISWQARRVHEDILDWLVDEAGTSN